MRDKSALTLSDPARSKAVMSIKRFFTEQLDQDVGDLKAMLVLDYILAEHGPTIYNQALADARAFMEERAADVEGLGFQQEYPALNAPKRSK
jgi:uncharacterized protein (DUF2164 family)